MSALLEGGEGVRQVDENSPTPYRSCLAGLSLLGTVDLGSLVST